MQHFATAGRPADRPAVGVFHFVWLICLRCFDILTDFPTSEVSAARVTEKKLFDEFVKI